jgi:hypothetical protein
MTKLETGMINKNLERTVNDGKPNKAKTVPVGFVQQTQAALINTINIQADIIRDLKKNRTIQFSINGLLIFLLAIFVLKPDPIPTYFGQDTQGRFTKLTPLASAEIHEVNVRIWTEGCITDALELSFQNPVKRLSKILGSCFNENGKRAYQKWLTYGQSKEMIELGRAGKVPADSELGAIIIGRTSMSASPKSPSRIQQIDNIIDPATNEQIARWEVTLPAIVRKESGVDNDGTGTVVVKVILARTNEPTFPYGVAVDSWQIVVGD